ncbi:MAG: hypothetical protein ACP5E3_09875, partial [Bacteroidales bacterium]
DTGFGSFIWGTERLGKTKDYVKKIQAKYGLKTSLHTPLAPWSSNDKLMLGPSAIESWPESSRRMIIDSFDNLVPAKAGAQICMGSRQYRQEAEERLNELCDAGIKFIMFDGTMWNGPCFDKSHGHPVPYLYEDHIDACVDMARRVHQNFPDVLIEMHDMLVGGQYSSVTPVYYKYGIPGSYDENWGFELMWKPMEHIKNKTAVAMYYYNLACNIPLYLHVNIGHDNENSVVLWWYASTTRHLGIGGDCSDSAILKNHHEDMKKYIELENFFKRGNFYGINEEIHIHSLPGRQECVINIFNLSEKSEITEGAVLLKDIGLDPEKEYKADKDWIKIEKGEVIVRKDMDSWDADLAILRIH